MSAIPCGRIRVVLEAYVDGDLAREDPELAEKVRDHLVTCADCRRQYVQAVSLPFRLKALSSPLPSQSLVGDVMRSIRPSPEAYRRAWILLAPEAVLVAFILWYLSGLEGLTSIASGVLADLQALIGWGSGAGPMPRVPEVDVVLLIALLALTAIAAYHLSILIRLSPGAGRRAASE
jgi:predicted anti-sigma-YlaC factor YlaD